VDIGSSTIKFLLTEGKYPETTKVLDYRLVQIGSKEKTITLEELQEIVKSTYQSLNCKLNEARTLIKPQQEVVRVVDLPDVDDDELKKAAGYQLNRYVPFGRDEAVYDCSPILGTSIVNGMRKCVLVATRRSNVDQHYKLFETANLAPVIIDVESVAVMNAYITAGTIFNKKNEISDNNKEIALVHLGASHTGLAVIREKMPIASRAINVGAERMVSQVKEILNVDPIIAVNKLSDDKLENDDIKNIINNFVNRVCEELKASLSYCKREFDVNVQSLYVTGGAANNKIIIQKLNEIIGLPVHTFNPFDIINLSALGDGKNDFNKNAPAFAPLLALAVRDV